MSSFYFFETPFDHWLVFEIKGRIKTISFSKDRIGAPLEGEIKKQVIEVFETRDFSNFDYALLDFSNVAGKRLVVYKFLLTTKIGQTVTYSEVAQRVFGDTKFRRVVARYLSMNQFAFFVPCHRVISKKGLGGYSEGVELKRKILLWEGVKL